jgi:hypothetical protein
MLRCLPAYSNALRAFEPGLRAARIVALLKSRCFLADVWKAVRRAYKYLGFCHSSVSSLYTLDHVCFQIDRQVWHVLLPRLLALHRWNSHEFMAMACFDRDLHKPKTTARSWNDCWEIEDAGTKTSSLSRSSFPLHFLVLLFVFSKTRQAVLWVGRCRPSQKQGREDRMFVAALDRLQSRKSLLEVN